VVAFTSIVPFDRFWNVIAVTFAFVDSTHAPGERGSLVASHRSVLGYALVPLATGFLRNQEAKTNPTSERVAIGFHKRFTSHPKPILDFLAS
jgi:hypothetical protein